MMENGARIFKMGMGGTNGGKGIVILVNGGMANLVVMVQ